MTFYFSVMLNLFVFYFCNGLLRYRSQWHHI